MLFLFVYLECCCYLCIGNAVVICVWECCFYLCNGNAVFIFVLGMMLFLYWEWRCYLCIGYNVVFCVLGMMLLFVYGNAPLFVHWECCYFRVRNIIFIHVSVMSLLFVYLVSWCHLCIGRNFICVSGVLLFVYRNDWTNGQSSRIWGTFSDQII